MEKKSRSVLIIVLSLIVVMNSCTNRTDDSKMMIEITRYKAAENVTHEELLTASDAFDRDFCSKCKGLVNRQFIKTEDGYMDIFLWETKEDIERVQKIFMQDEDAMKFARLTDSSSLSMKNYEVLKTSSFSD